MSTSISNNFLREPTSKEVKQLSKWRRSTFWVCLLGYVGYYLCRKNISAAFPLLAQEFNFTNTQLGLIAFYSEIAYAIGKFINGPLADKYGGKRLFLIGMIGAIASNLIFVMGSSLIYFIITWCICRYFLSMGWGGLTKMIGHWYEPERNGIVMGVISLNFQFGGVIATLLAGIIVSLNYSWIWVFIYPSIILSIIFIWSYFYSRESPDKVIANTNFGYSKKIKKFTTEIKIDQQQRFSPPWIIIKDLLRLKIYRSLLLFSFLTTFLRSIFFFWTPKLLVDIGLGTSNAILKSALFPLLGCLGTIFLGWYTDHYAKNGDRAKMMWIMLTGLIISLLLVSYLITIKADSDFIVLFIGLCGLFLLGPYSMSSGCLTLDIAGASRAGTATGMIDGLGYIGGAVAVWGAGKLSDQLGWAEVFMILSFFAFIATYSAYKMSLEFQATSNKLNL